MILRKLVLSGGGLNGISYIGVIQKFEELIASGDLSLELDEVLCVSVGSIMGLLYLIGYTSEEMKREMLKVKLNKLKNIRVTNLLQHFGLDSGTRIMEWIKTLMNEKGYISRLTFKEFYDKRKINFKIYATNLNTQSLVEFNYLSHPDMPILDAIRMSMSIPFVFSSVKYHGDVYVDGGVVNNYPINFIPDTSLSETLGILCLHKQHTIDEIDSFENYAQAVVQCMLKNRLAISNTVFKQNQDRTIQIEVDVADSVNFDLKRDQITRMIERGYSACEQFFSLLDIKK